MDESNLHCKLTLKYDPIRLSYPARRAAYIYGELGIMDQYLFQFSTPS